MTAPWKPYSWSITRGHSLLNEELSSCLSIGSSRTASSDLSFLRRDWQFGVGHLSVLHSSPLEMPPTRLTGRSPLRWPHKQGFSASWATAPWASLPETTLRTGRKSGWEQIGLKRKVPQEPATAALRHTGGWWIFAPALRADSRTDKSYLELLQFLAAS